MMLIFRKSLRGVVILTNISVVIIMGVCDCLINNNLCLEISMTLNVELFFRGGARMLKQAGPAAGPKAVWYGLTNLG